MRLEHDVPLAPWTTLGLGGSAARVATLTREEDVPEALREAEAAGEPVLVLGGGSNVVVADEGVRDALVLRVAMRGLSVEPHAGGVRLTVAAGEPWDDVVAHAVDSGHAGVECLSGIPGLAGATPIQNVGAYGQEVADTIESVRAYDRDARAFVTLEPAACAFGYRTSRLKTTDRFIVTAVTFSLPRSADSASIRYPELARALGVAEGAAAPLRTVRDVVLKLRRGKGMVVDPDDPESRSAGSFFINPILGDAALAQLEARVAEAQVGPVPRFAAGDGRWKVPAAWLIERAGFTKGYGPGPVRVSARHTLALVHAGGGSTRALLALAREIQRGVEARFGVTLTPEPVLVGCCL
jgi:UDP-N-acetylmuramate dehydrogenase